MKNKLGIVKKISVSVLLFSFILILFSLPCLFAVSKEKSHFGYMGNNSGLGILPPPGDTLPWSTSFNKPNYPYYFTPFEELGFKWDRPHPGPFNRRIIEPTQGNYDFSLTDLYVSSAQSRGIEIVATIWPFTDWDQAFWRDLPGWTSSYDEWRVDLSTSRYKPADMASYRNFIKAMVERYDGDGYNDMPGLLYPVKYWEILNEPETSSNPPGQGAFFRSTNTTSVSDYVDLVKNTAEAIHEAYPDAIILNGGATGPQGEYWNPVLSQGASQYIDIGNWHNLFQPEQINDLATSAWLDIVSPYGITKVWNTEYQIFISAQHYCPTENDQAIRLVKGYVQAFGAGAERIFYIMFSQTDSGFCDPTNNPTNPRKRPSYYAAKTLIQKIDGFTSVTKISDGKYKFKVDGCDVYVLWSDTGGGVPSEITGTVLMTSVTGYTTVKEASEIVLSSSPIYVEYFTGYIAGKVTSTVDGSALSGCLIEVLQGGIVKSSTTCDTNGNYLIKITTGTYDVKASSTGFNSDTKSNIVVVLNTTTTVNFSLSLGDFIPPGQITGFAAKTNLQVKLSWTAPGDNGYNGNVTGGAFEIRYSSTVGSTADTAEWTIIKSSSFVQGVTYSELLTGLKPRTTYYFWIRARDENVNNWSVWSDTAVVVSGSFIDINAVLPGVSYCYLSWGDYDNDGDLDLAIAGDTVSDRITKIYRNDNGNFVDINAGLPGVSYCSLSWGDYDNDGDLDLAIAGDGNEGYITKIYRNDNGNFVDINAGLPGVSYCSLSWGDYDNDGDLDLAIAGSGNEGYISKIYRNDNGNFVDINAGLTGVSNCSLSWGDYDNDGDLDLAIAGDGDGGYISKIYRNDNGNFVDINAGLTGVSNCSLSWGDYDNDGDLDLAIAGSGNEGYISKIYRNDNGNFVDINAGLPGVSYCSLSWGDYDNDGDLDLAIAGDGDEGYISKIYRNDNGNFVDINAGLTGVYSCSLSWGDYDNDGDLDLAITGYGASDNYISKIYKSLEAEFGNVNSKPSGPTTGFSSTYDPINGLIQLKWDYGSDTETSQQKGLYYNVRVATEPINDNITKWIVSPSTGAGMTPFLGNYPHGFCIAVSTQPGFNLKPTLEGVTYYWQVRTIDTGLRQSEWSVQQSTYVPNESPTIPVLLEPINGTATNQLTITFDWTDSTDTVSGVSNYELQVSTDINFGIINYSSAPTVSQAIITLAENLYYWRVRAKDNAGNYSNWTSTYSISVDTTPPVSVGFESLNVLSSSTIKIIGTANDAISGLHSQPYYIQCSTDGIIWGNNDSGWVVSSHTWTGLSPNTTYWFRIKARDNAGNESVWTSTATKVTLANPPVGSYVSSVSSYSITLNWSANGNPSYTRWGILRSTDNFVTSTTMLTDFGTKLTNTSYTDAGLDTATTYYYKVCAFNEEGIATAFDVTVSTITQPAPLDTTPPYIVFSYPPDKSTNVSVYTSSVVFIFNEPMLTGNNFSIKVLSNYPLLESTPTWKSNTEFVLTHPVPLLPNTTYTIELNPVDIGFKDLAGNPLATTTITFCTGALPVVTYSIRGYVKDYANNPLSSVVVNLSGKVSKSTTTAEDGSYVFYELTSGSYTVTPTKDGWSFTPVSRTTETLSGNITNWDFIGKPKKFNITGIVAIKNEPDKGIPLVVIQVFDERNNKIASFTTDGSGRYEFNDLDGGKSYTIIPKKENWDFEPSSYTVYLVTNTIINFAGIYRLTDITPTKIDLPLGENNQIVTVDMPKPAEVKIIVGERSEKPKEQRGTINPYKGEIVGIVFNPNKKPNEYIGQKFTIRIFTLTGEVVEEFTKIPQTADDIWMKWVPKDIASGIYIVYVEGPGVKVHKKIAIVR